MRPMRTLALLALVAAGLSPASPAAAQPQDLADTAVLSVGLTGDGMGSVTSDPAGIDCGGEGDACDAEYEAGTRVTLTATASPGSAFVSWGGECIGRGPCEVTMDEAQYVEALFDSRMLHVFLDGDGIGQVTSSPAGIECGDGAFECYAPFPPGTEVTLTAAADAVSTFLGWDGACTGTDECVVTMNGDHEVVATFDAPVLSVSLDGDGAGGVVSDPAGIDCGGDAFECVEAYESGTEVTLSATPSAESAFVGWDGACSGTGPASSR